jgi:hypothetical protein
VQHAYQNHPVVARELARGSSGAGFTGCGKIQNAVILSEAKNLSLFLCLYLNRREILRFAQNDKTRHFFRSLFSLRGLVAAQSLCLQPKPTG